MYKVFICVDSSHCSCMEVYVVGAACGPQFCRPNTGSALDGVWTLLWNLVRLSVLTREHSQAVAM